jgi:hypothetical protein
MEPNTPPTTHNHLSSEMEIHLLRVSVGIWEDCNWNQFILNYDATIVFTAKFLIDSDADR